MIDESIQRVVPIAVGVAGLAVLQWIAILQEPARRVVAAVGQRIVHPLPDFVGQRRDVLRENPRVIDVVKVHVGLDAVGIAVRGMVAANTAAAALRQVNVKGLEDDQCVGQDLGKLGDDACSLVLNQLMSTSPARTPNGVPVTPRLAGGLRVCVASTVGADR